MQKLEILCFSCKWSGENHGIMLARNFKVFYSRSDEWEINRGFFQRSEMMLKAWSAASESERKGCDGWGSCKLCHLSCPFTEISSFGLSSVISHPSKVCGCYSVTFLNWTPVFHWCVVRCGSKNKHYKDGTCLKEIGICLQILLPNSHLIVNTIGRTCVRPYPGNVINKLTIIIE